MQTGVIINLWKAVASGDRERVELAQQEAEKFLDNRQVVSLRSFLAEMHRMISAGDIDVGSVALMQYLELQFQGLRLSSVEVKIDRILAAVEAKNPPVE